jgi:hypothetical protein
MFFVISLLLVTAFLSGFVPIVGQNRAQSPAKDAASKPGIQAMNAVRSVPSEETTLSYQTTVPQPSDQARSLWQQGGGHRLPAPPTLWALGRTSVPNVPAVSITPIPNSVKPTDFQLFVNSTVSLPSGSTHVTNEPSVANDGSIIFYVGNGPNMGNGCCGYTARSLDGGATWTYISATTGMSDFCCDQDVVFIPSYSIFVWVRQGCPLVNGVCDYNSATATNRYRIGVSADTTNWFFYDITQQL